MDDLLNSILDLKREIQEWRSADEHYEWDSNFQRKLERLSEMQARYDEMNENYWKSVDGNTRES